MRATTMINSVKSQLAPNNQASSTQDQEVREGASIVTDHSSSMLHAALACLREKPPHISSLIVMIAICAMVLAVVAHGEVACAVIGAISVTALVVAGFRVK
jgi:hypothetical protein